VAVKRLGVPPYLYCKPLLHGLEDASDIEIVIDVPARNAIKLREHDLDAAFLSPIEYARDSSDYVIVRGIAVSSSSATETITLRFRESLHKIRALAVDPSSSSEIILARVILAEEFDINPAIVPVMGSLEDMLNKADGALLVGDAALRVPGEDKSAIDLVDFWNDITGLPFVHGFWCAREQDMTAEVVSQLQSAKARGVQHIHALATELPPPAPGLAVAEYLEQFSYDLAEEELEAVREFIKYAYYHGVLPDVAELALFPLEPGETAADGSVSPN